MNIAWFKLEMFSSWSKVEVNQYQWTCAAMAQFWATLAIMLFYFPVNKEAKDNPHNQEWKKDSLSKIISKTFKPHHRTHLICSIIFHIILSCHCCFLVSWLLESICCTTTTKPFATFICKAKTSKYGYCEKHNHILILKWWQEL